MKKILFIVLMVFNAGFPAFAVVCPGGETSIAGLDSAPSSAYMTFSGNSYIKLGEFDYAAACGDSPTQLNLAGASTAPYCGGPGNIIYGCGQMGASCSFIVGNYVSGACGTDGSNNMYSYHYLCLSPISSASTCPPPDADYDGTPDASDQCPGTPPTTSVDAEGCPPGCKNGSADQGEAGLDCGGPCGPCPNHTPLAPCGGAVPDGPPE